MFYSIKELVEQAEQLRYGLEGRLQIITGKKSYLRYYLDDFMNWESIRQKSSHSHPWRN